MAVKLVLEPRVYVVGRQKVDADELGRFLVDCGSRGWTTDTDVSAEVLVEVAGRNCYQSFKASRPGGNAAYIKHLLEVSHGSVLEHANWSFIITGVSRSLCYLPDTEILTKAGWKRIDSIADDETLLTKDPATGSCRWSRNHRLHKMQHVGDVHWFENREWKSPAFTPDHITWYAPYDLRKNRGLGLREIMAGGAAKAPYRDVAGKRFVVDRSITMESSRDPERISIGGISYDAEDFFRWLGWLFTDGHILKNRNRMAIVQSKQGNLTAIASLMERLFPGRWRMGFCKRTGLHSFSIFDRNIKSILVSRFGRTKSNRRLTWLFDYSPRLLRAFAESAIAGDGSVDKTSGHRVLYCYSEETAGDFQVLWAMLGMSSNVRHVDRRGATNRELGGVAIVNRVVEFVVSLHSKGQTLVRPKHQQTIWYAGTVYCPHTDDGLVFVRRNGAAFWSGNTHELVRHRHLSFSQLSQRYVDESNVAFVVPPALMSEVTSANALSDSLKMGGCDRLTDSERVGLGWIASAERDLDEYIALVEYLSSGDRFPGITDRTERRKAAREAARSVLPNSTETSIFVTANARALRNFLELRGSRHADAEMARLSVRLLGILQAESPNIFGEYRLVDIGNGRQEIITDYRKV